MQKFKYLLLSLPLLAMTLFSCHAQRKVENKKVNTETAQAIVDTFQAEKSKKGDDFIQLKMRTWDNKIVATDGLIKGEPILFVLFNPGCGHCKEIVQVVRDNIGMFKEANIIFITGKPLQGRLLKFVGELKVDKMDEIIVAGDDSDSMNKLFEYNGIPQIMIYDKEHKLEHIFYKEASLLEIQNKMYGK